MRAVAAKTRRAAAPRPRRTQEARTKRSRAQILAAALKLFSRRGYHGTSIRDIAQAGRNQLTGTLTLGVIYTVAPYLLPDLIPALHDRAPQMPLDIEENLTENLETGLRTLFFFGISGTYYFNAE